MGIESSTEKKEVCLLFLVLNQNITPLCAVRVPIILILKESLSTLSSSFNKAFYQN